jgi:hypothetical protein
METDHDELAREVESRGDDMEERRDELERETSSARQGLRENVADQSVPGVQDEQEDVLGGREAVEEAQADEGDAGDGDSAEDADASVDEEDDESG